MPGCIKEVKHADRTTSVGNVDPPSTGQYSGNLDKDKNNGDVSGHETGDQMGAQDTHQGLPLLKVWNRNSHAPNGKVKVAGREARETDVS